MQDIVVMDQQASSAITDPHCHGVRSMQRRDEESVGPQPHVQDAVTRICGWR